jgi:hypothetical protein
MRREALLSALPALIFAAPASAALLSVPADLPLAPVGAVPLAPVFSLSAPAPAFGPGLPAAAPSAALALSAEPLRAAGLPRASFAAPAELEPAAAAVAPAAEARTPRDLSATVEKDAVTGLYGVSESQLSAIVAILRRRYGDGLLDLAAIGSRAKGKASALKQFRPPTGYSDLDLAPLLRDGRGRHPSSAEVEREIKDATGLPIQLHGVISMGESRFGYSVPFYGGGYETYESFEAGDAVRIPFD